MNVPQCSRDEKHGLAHIRIKETKPLWVWSFKQGCPLHHPSVVMYKAFLRDAFLVLVTQLTAQSIVS